MELGQHQIQIALCLVLILGAALAALVCDLLKRNNDQLRELALELKVRRETAAPAAPAPAAAPMVERPKPAATRIEEPAPVARPPIASAVKRSERREKRPLAPEALAAIQRGVELAASPRPRRVPEPVVPAPQSVIEEVVAETPSPKTTRDWTSVLKKGRDLGQVTEQALPAGFQDGFVLTRLVESHQPVSGLVVSIGASASQDANRGVPSDVRALIQSLIGPNDFAAQAGPDEFLLIYPGERGASAQHRLVHIAEQLWDFQLRSMGTLSILFSWGGVEVRSESIDEAIASATERMQETRRNRRVLTMEPRPLADAPLRRAV